MSRAVIIASQAANLRGGSGTRYEGLAAPAMGRGAHSEFPRRVTGLAHPSLSRKPLSDRTRLGRGPAVGLRAECSFIRGTLFECTNPARFNFSGHRGRWSSQLRFKPRKHARGRFANRFRFAPVAVAVHEQQQIRKDRHDVVRARQGRGYE